MDKKSFLKIAMILFVISLFFYFNFSIFVFFQSEKNAEEKFSLEKVIKGDNFFGRKKEVYINNFVKPSMLYIEYKELSKQSKRKTKAGLGVVFIILSFIVLHFLSIKKNIWKNIEHGSAEWGDFLERIKNKLNIKAVVRYRYNALKLKEKELKESLKRAKREKLIGEVEKISKRIKEVKIEIKLKEKEYKILKKKRLEEINQNTFNAIKKEKENILKKEKMTEKEIIELIEKYEKEVKKEIEKQILKQDKEKNEKNIEIQLRKEILKKEITMPKQKKFFIPHQESPNYFDFYYKNYNKMLYKKRLPSLEEIEFEKNIMLSETEFLPVDDRAIFRNLNILVVGGSGAGKSRYFVKPNILAATMNMVVTDPKGELYEDTNSQLKKLGYNIKVLNLKEFEKSNKYNPFKYIRNDSDVPVIVETLLNKGKNNKADFWENSAKQIFIGMVYYYYYEYKKTLEKDENAKLPTMYDLINNISDLGYDREDENAKKSEFYERIERLLESSEEHPAKIYFKDYMKGSEKTNSGIRQTLTTNLSYLTAPNIKSIMQEDTFDLDNVSEKSIIYVIISDSNSAYNALASLFFSQLFQVLYYNADKLAGKRLPIPVQFYLDEFANIGQINSFSEILATCRGRRIGIAPIIQSLAQLEHLYEKNSSTIIGNCDTLLYLGGNDYETMEKISKMIGNATVDTERQGKSKSFGQQKSHSLSDNVNAVGRALMTPDELKRLKDTQCIIMIRGFKPFLSEKLNVDKFYDKLYIELSIRKEFEKEFKKINENDKKINLEKEEESILENDKKLVEEEIETEEKIDETEKIERTAEEETLKEYDYDFL